MPVIDVRPFALAMVSTSTDRQQAANAMSYGNDDGLGFVAQTPPTARTTALDLRYRIDRLLADGALFIPSQMEHKWAVFHHHHHLLVVRSWAREVRLTARTRADGDSLIVVDAVGTISSPDEDPAFTAAAVDFIIRSHCLGEVAPAPLHADVGDDLQQAEQMSYSLFGNKALFATPHRFAADPPTGVLRSSSLFHIAVARGDLAAAQSQLRVGVPIDLIAQDGLTAMHWALSTPDVVAMQWLVDHGLSVDIPSVDGATALMNAVQSNQIDKIKWLLDARADPNATDHRGFTSLHRAAEMGHTDGARLLLAGGADPTVKALGHTPLSLARLKQNDEVIALLQPTFDAGPR